MALSEKKKITDKAYKSKLDQIRIQPWAEEGTQIRAAAAAAGQSVQGYVLEAVRRRMAQECEQKEHK